MPDSASTEFWKDIKPITNVFKLPEIFCREADTDDLRYYYVPFTETVFTRPPRRTAGATTATAGDFLYEAPGEAHMLVAYEHEDPMKIFFNVTGPLIWLDENGEPEGHFDVHDYIALAKEHYEKVGLGATYMEGMFR